MDILIACHCHKQKLSISNYPAQANVLNKKSFAKYGINSVKYMEIQGCREGTHQYVDWKTIPSQSIDRIWLMNCPVYSPKIRFLRILDGKQAYTKEEKRLFQELFEEGWRILKSGGKIMIPGSTEERAYAFSRFAYIIGNDPNPWKLSVRNIKDVEFHIDDPMHTLEEDEYHIYYEKPFPNRKRQTRKHNRRLKIDS